MHHDSLMEKCVFSLQLPRKPAVGDEIVIKGTLKQDAQRFSVNFCLPRLECVHPLGEPDQIAYHFGLRFDDGVSGCQVVQASKNNKWEQGSISPDEWLSTRAIHFTFRFHLDVIKVFIDDTQHAPDYEYEHRYPIEQIESVELWDDVEKVDEITLRFGA